MDIKASAKQELEQLQKSILPLTRMHLENGQGGLSRAASQLLVGKTPKDLPAMRVQHSRDI